MIPSRMRRETDIHISCGEVLKVQPRTIVHTRVQKGENEESVGSSDDVAPPQGEEASYFHITLCDETPIEGEDAEEAPHELEEGVRAVIDELKEVDLGTLENPRPIFISILLSNEDEKIYVELLKEYIDVFAWTYKEMPGIVPVRKKNGQIRVYVDFRDLNVACPKDDFPLPITELMIDAVTGHEIMSFMDGSSGYDQIRMASEDEELTAFRTPKGIYCYKVMPFGLKNAGATYQRAMQRIFDDMLHKMVECYFDDLVVKSKLRTDHLGHLRKVFDRLRKFQLKMNPLKCAFGVAAGNRDHGKCGLRHRVEVLILAMELKSLSKRDVAVIQKEVSTILTRRAKPRRVFALKNPLTSINFVVMLSTAFSERSDHLWRQQHEARGLEVSIEISPSNGNPPSMYKSRSDMDISPEERFSEEVKYIFSPFPVSRSVNEFASKIDVVTPLDLIINYAIPQLGKDVRGRFVFQSRLQSPHFGQRNVVLRSPVAFVIRHRSFVHRTIDLEIAPF
nr:uncharacterized protein LOC104648515 [Ipomoea trifida]